MTKCQYCGDYQLTIICHWYTFNVIETMKSIGEDNTLDRYDIYLG
jgi:hypothetical protein